MWCRWQPWHLLPLTLVLLLPSIWAADRTAAVRNSKDPQLVVVDEVLGQWIALAFVPALAPGWFAAAFLLFRAFDIWKPWPVRSLERLPGGTGIVADDIAAGAWAALVLKLAGWLNHL
jgi:phosphatidylglycerophosphatase A